MTATKNKFLVVSYDAAEQQAFYDWVLAEDEDEAAEIIGECIRVDHALLVDVFSGEALTALAQEFAAATPQAVSKDFAARVRELTPACPWCGALVRVGVDCSLHCECVDEGEYGAMQREIREAEYGEES